MCIQVNDYNYKTHKICWTNSHLNKSNIYWRYPWIVSPLHSRINVWRETKSRTCESSNVNCLDILQFLTVFLSHNCITITNYLNCLQQTWRGFSLWCGGLGDVFPCSAVIPFKCLLFQDVRLLDALLQKFLWDLEVLGVLVHGLTRRVVLHTLLLLLVGKAMLQQGTKRSHYHIGHGCMDHWVMWG